MIHPVGHRVLIKPDEAESKSKGGILIPTDDRHQAAVDTGVVLAIGDTAYQDPTLGGKPWVAIGDWVTYARHSGKRIKDPEKPDDIDCVILNDEDIIAILKKGE